MQLKTLVLNKKNGWILLGLFTIALSGLLSPGVVERYYSRGVFQAVRWAFTGLGSWMPFAGVYLLFFLLLGWAFYSARRSWRRKSTWPARMFGGLHSLLALAGGAVFFFQALWGFNYGRIPLEDGLGLVPRPLETYELKEELDSATAETARLRCLLPGGEGDSVLQKSLLPSDIEAIMRENLKKTLAGHGYPVPGKVRGRQLLPKGILLRISTAGVYIPFTGEGNVDAGLHFLQLPFVLAHEMSHGYGFGDEGTCNFLAYLACLESDDPFLRYVGNLYYWRYVASEYRAARPEAYAIFRESLPTGIRSDVRAIQAEMDKYPDILPELRDATYNAYLQAQGIPEGIKNYDRVIMLVHAWRKHGQTAH